MRHPRILLPDLEPRLHAAIEHFWRTRQDQGDRQGADAKARDVGNRPQVTAGKHLDALVTLVVDLVKTNCPSATPHRQTSVRDTATVLPGYFRPTKLWDI
ncbi:MAG: hypothetical protein JNL38_06740, partial [Myxococcales bacterium]|nr:hypothetical protein [Myxococcales bacterium]